jgi:hypothetical protein
MIPTQTHCDNQAPPKPVGEFCSPSPATTIRELGSCSSLAQRQPTLRIKKSKRDTRISYWRIWSMAKKKKWYAIRAGFKTGVFETWEECKLHVDGFRGASFKAFDSQQEASDFVSGMLPCGPEPASQTNCGSSISGVGFSVRTELTGESAVEFLSVKKRGREPDVTPAITPLQMPISNAADAHSFLSVEKLSPRPSSHCNCDCQSVGICKCEAMLHARSPQHLLLQTYLHGYNLSADQLKLCELADSGCNVFLTGLGGTGKSHILQLLVKYLRRKWAGGNKKAGRSAVVLASSTGVSAVGIGGVTLHSIVGCGVPRFAAHFERIWSRRSVWKSMKVGRICYIQ